MSSEPISATAYTIAPIQLKPTQDVLVVDDSRSSSINYIVGKLIPGKPAVPAIPAVVGCGAVLERGKPGDANYQPYVPAVAGSPAIPAVAPIPDAVVPIERGTIEMTDDEWKAWLTQDDKTYRASIVAKRLGLTISK